MAGVIALALAVAAWSFAVMTRQLSVARSSSGGRALMFLAGRTGNVEHPARFIGPGQLAEVHEYLVKTSCRRWPGDMTDIADQR